MARTLAIGDIHGCYRALESLLSLVRLDPKDTLITLAITLTAVPQSRQVLDRLIALSRTHNLVPLRATTKQ